MDVSRVVFLEHIPTIEERCAIASTLANLSKGLKHPYEVRAVDAGYVVIKTGDQQLQNAVGILKAGIAFYTDDEPLIRLLKEHGFEPRCEPLKNETSAHNKYRYMIPHVSGTTISNYRPLFLTMLHDSVSYIQDPALSPKEPYQCQT